MKELDLVLINQLGLHARAASKLVNLALRFGSEMEVEVVKTGVKANCKSIYNNSAINIPRIILLPNV